MNGTPINRPRNRWPATAKQLEAVRRAGLNRPLVPSPANAAAAALPDLHHPTKERTP